MSENGDTFNVLANDEEVPGDFETLQQPVLFVPTVEKNEDLSGPPLDGHGYLKRVMVERKRCNPVVVKNIPTLKPQKNLAKQVLDFPEDKCNPDFCMDKETQLHTVAQFSKLRLKYETRRSKIPPAVLTRIQQRLPKKQRETSWLEILSSTPPNVADAMASLDNSSIELCLAITQPKICAVLEYMVDWITEGDMRLPVACHWIYTLLACTELPLDPDMCAVMRRIARAIITHRSQLESIDSEELPHINIIICVIGRYFNQFDLADPMT